MKAPNTRRLLREDIDLKTDQGVDQLFDVLNLFFEQVNLLFSGNISFGDNINGRFIEASFTTPSDYPTNFTSVTIPWSTGTGISVVLLGQITNLDSPGTLITSSVSITNWSQTTQNAFKLNYITGLTASTRYRVRLLVLGA